MIATVDFEINGTEYRIERGRRPNALKFFIDGREQLIMNSKVTCEKPKKK